jgi:prepilin-type processing-associated H-X9-DG protein
MRNAIPPPQARMPMDNLPSKLRDPRERPFQFRLWHLFILMTVIAVVISAFSQLGFQAISWLILGLAAFLVIYAVVKGKLAYAFVGFIVASLWAMILPGQHVYGPSPRLLCELRLRQIAAALNEYEQAFGSYPPAYFADKNGKPMHSWRAIVYSNCDTEFKAGYRFDEPWDSPNNRKAAAKVGTPNLFSCPKEKSPSLSGETSYVAVVGPWTMFPGAKAVSEKDIKDGHGNTILLVEIHHSGIYWTEPGDLDVQQVVGIKSGRGLSSPHGAGANVLMADGSVQYLENASLTPALIRALLTIDGGEDVTIP